MPPPLNRYVHLTGRDDRVAEGARLEIVCVARHRGFESRSLRNRFKKTFVQQLMPCSLWLRVTGS